MATFVNQINTSLVSKAERVFLGDDIIIDLSSMVGAAIMADPNLSIEIGLWEGATINATTITPIVDGVYGTVFLNGTVCGVIQNAILDVLPRASYALMLRVIQNVGTTEELQRTYRLPITYTLITV